MPIGSNGHRIATGLKKYRITKANGSVLLLFALLNVPLGKKVNRFLWCFPRDQQWFSRIVSFRAVLSIACMFSVASPSANFLPCSWSTISVCHFQAGVSWLCRCRPFCICD